MHSKELYDEERVLLLLSQGSEYAFTQVFDHYRGKVYSVAVKFLKSPTLAEEIVQDVFLKIWLKREEMAAVKNLEGYIFVMARNKLFDMIKKTAYEVTQQKNMLSAGLQTGETNDATHLVEDHQYQKLLQQAIDKLPPQQKEVYKLSKIEGLTREAIAQQLNISPLTVKTHMAAAAKAIRDNLGNNLGLVYISLLITAAS